MGANRLLGEPVCRGCRHLRDCHAPNRRTGRLTCTVIFLPTYGSFARCMCPGYEDARQPAPPAPEEP